MDLPSASSLWAGIHSDILLIVIECASLREFLDSSPHSWPDDVDIPQMNLRNRYRYTLRRRRDDGILPFLGVCKNWRAIAISGPLKAPIVSCIVRFQTWQDKSFPDLSDLVKTMQEISKESQVEILVDSQITTATEHLSLFLKGIAPFVRRLDLGPFTASAHGHPESLDEDSRLPSIYFHKLMELRIFETSTFNPLWTKDDAPKLLRLTVLAADMAPFMLSEFRPAQLFILTPELYVLPSALFIAIGRHLHRLEFDGLADAGNLATDVVLLPNLTHLSLTRLHNLIAFRIHTRKIAAPRLTNLRAVVQQREPDPEANLLETLDAIGALDEHFVPGPTLAKYPNLYDLNLEGICICLSLVAARSDSCPNLHSLWLVGPNPEHGQPMPNLCEIKSHWSYLRVSEYKCLARAVHLISYNFEDLRPKFLVTEAQFPLIESLLLHWPFGSTFDVISADWNVLVRRHESIRRLILRNGNYASAVYAGERHPHPLRAITVDFFTRNNHYGPDQTLEVPTLKLDLVARPILSPRRLAYFPVTHTLIFDARRGYSYQLDRYIDFYLLGDRDGGQKTGIRQTIKDGLNKLGGRKPKSVPFQAPFPSLRTLVIATRRPRTSTPYAYDGFGSRLRDIIGMRHTSYPLGRITEIISTLLPEYEDDREWFASRGIKWTLMPFGEDAVNAIYYRGAGEPARRRNDWNMDPYSVARRG